MNHPAYHHGHPEARRSVACSPVGVEDDGPAVDDEVGELPGDAEGALPLPLALLAVRRGLRRLPDPVHPLQRLVPRLPRHLVGDGCAKQGTITGGNQYRAFPSLGYKVDFLFLRHLNMQ